MSVAKGRVVLVTGASGSIGREIAAQAGAQGWLTLVHGRSAEASVRAAEELTRRLPAARFAPIAADFVVEGAVSEMIARIRTEYGRLDGVVNSAASAPDGILGPFADTDPHAYTALCLHAITTLQQLCHAAFPLLAEQDGGSLVTIASDAGLFAAPNQSLIGTTRAAIMTFCRNVALEAAHDGIRVNCISPSYVENTRVFDMMLEKGSRRPETARKRAGLGLPGPAHIADLALFLLGPLSTRITGQIISINGGLNA